MTDDLGREPISSIARASGCRHLTRLLTPIPGSGSTKLRCKAANRQLYNDLERAARELAQWIVQDLPEYDKACEN